MRVLRTLCAAAGACCSGASALGIAVAVAPALSGSLGYYALVAAANMPRLALAGILGTLLGSLAGTEPRWLGTLAVTAGVGSTLVSSAFVAAVMLRAHSLGLPFSPPSLGPGASERRWLAPEAITLASSDPGWRIEADLYRPAVDGRLLKRDAIVVVHGGAWRHGDKGESPWSNQWLVERGYVVLDIQYRLAPVADWRVPVRDVRCAVAWLRAHAGELGVDPGRVALLGRSAGGHLALLAAYMPDGTSSCPPWSGGPWAVVAFYAPTDLLQAYAQAADGDDLREGLRALLGAEPGTGEQTYRDASPLEQVSAYGPPTLLIHGTWDDLVPLEHSRRLAAKLAASGAHVRVVEVPFARHAFDLVPDGLQTLLAHESIAAFLEGRLADPG